MRKLEYWTNLAQTFLPGIQLDQKIPVSSLKEWYRAKYSALRRVKWSDSLELCVLANKRSQPVHSDYLLQEDHYQRAPGQTHYLWQSCRR